MRIRPGALVEVGAAAVSPGGCVGNTGRELLSLGVPTTLTARVGEDYFGTVLTRRLAELVEGSRAADTSRLDVKMVRGASTSYSIVVQPPAGDRMFLHHLGANIHFEGNDIDLEGVDMVHVGYPTVLPQLSADGGKALVTLLQRARDSGVTTSVDLSVIDDRSREKWVTWRRAFRDVLPFIDVLSPSLEDLAFIDGRPKDEGVDRMARVAAMLVEGGAGVVALGGGARGLVLRTSSARRLASGGRVLAELGASWENRELWVGAWAPRIVSTVGAGDAASAGLLFGLIGSVGPDEAIVAAGTSAAARVAGLTREEIEERRNRGEDLLPPGGGWVQAGGGVFAGAEDGAAARVER